MYRRVLLPGALVALGLSLLSATPVAFADRPPSREPLHLPYDSDPEVPNGAHLLPAPTRTQAATESPRNSPAVPAAAARKPPRPGRLFLAAHRAAAWFFARVPGGILR